MAVRRCWDSRGVSGPVELEGRKTCEGVAALASFHHALGALDYVL